MGLHTGFSTYEVDGQNNEHMITNDTDEVKQLFMDRERQQMLKNADELKTPHDREIAVEFIVKQDSPDISLLKYLLEFGTAFNNTLLSCAVRKQHIDVVEILLDHGADIKVGDSFGWAVLGGNLKIISLLLKRGADPNHFSQLFVYKGFVLGMAVMEGRMDIMKKLLDSGADIKEGFVLGYAYRSSNMIKTKIMLERPVHKNNINDSFMTVPTTCSLMCTLFILNHTFQEAALDRGDDKTSHDIELRVNMQRIFFNGIPSEWTFNDRPIFSDTCVLPSYKLQINGKHIHKMKCWILFQYCTIDTCYHLWKDSSRGLFSENAFGEVESIKMTGMDFLNLYSMWDSTKCKEQKLTCLENNVCKNKEENNVDEYEDENNVDENGDENNVDENGDENNVDEKDENNVDENGDENNVVERDENNVDENGDENNVDETDENNVDENGDENNVDERDENNVDENGNENNVDEKDENNVDENGDEKNKDINDTQGYEECTWDEECQDVEKLLPSKSMLEESDHVFQYFQIEDSFIEEQFKSFEKRLESFLYLVKEDVDIDSLALAGFFNTGESVRCFCCYVVISFMEIGDDPWKEHAKRSPDCAYLRTKTDAGYSDHVLQQVTEENLVQHSETHPDNVKAKIDLMRERKFLDPDDGGIGIGEADVDTVQKRNGLGHLILFEEDRNERRAIMMVKTKHFFKDISDVKFHDQKVVNKKLTQKISKETLKLIRSLREQSYQTKVFIYMVQDVMSRLSSYSLWPHRTIRTGPLVEAGFSCKDPQTATVKCTACGLELNASTLNGTTPLEYHKKNSPDCEFFNQPISQNTDGMQIRTSTDSLNSPALSGNSHGATAYADPQLSVESTQTGDTLSRSQSRSNLNYNDSITQTPQEQDRNISMDDAPSKNDHRHTDSSKNAAVSSDPLVAERPRTGEVFDRTALAVPNDNNVTSSGEAVTEIENTILGAEGGNVPYPIRNARYTEQNARRESYTHWPHRRAHDIDRLVNAGFFYTGAEDIVRCFYCDIGLAEWNPDDDPWVEHARHSPECPYLRDQKGQDYINNIQTQWAKIYTPKHPQHSQVEERRRTFRHENWPRDNVLQSPEQLAAAGFFYTGEGDTVRCHYCDGGLREWEPLDDPWVEHARWFPFCKFVLKIKGIDFIQASATGNPGNRLQAPVAPPVTPHDNEPPQALSYVDSCRIKEQRNPMYTAAAQSLKSMGYSRETIRMVIDNYIAHTGRRDFKAADLMDIVMKMEDAGAQFLESDGENDDEIGASASKAAAGGCDDEMELSAAAMKKENEYLKQKYKCKVCDQNERCVVFVPCGHRITCQRCGEKASTCPHCDSKIEQRYKTYLG